MKHQLSILLRLPWTWWVASLWLLLRLSFKSFIMMCLDAGLLLFILFGVCWAFRICIFLKWNLGPFQPLFFKYSFCSFLSYSSGTPIMLAHLVVTQRSLRLCSFLSINFYSSSSDWITSVDLSESSLILFSACWIMLFSSSGEFFISVIVLFNSRVCIWFFFINFISWCFLFVEIAFSNFSLVLYKCFI